LAQGDTPTDAAPPLPQLAVNALNKLSGGPHAGYRANHAKGVMVSGAFAASKGAATLCKAPQFQRGKTIPVLVRFSDATGVPNLPNADPNASPHGMAIHFQLPDGTSTDIVSISSNGFPVATPEDFVALLTAIAQSGPGTAKPTPVEQFMSAHPLAAKWAATPRPAPVSFGTLAFYGVNAFQFTNAKGLRHYIRYRIAPESGEQSLAAVDAAKAQPDYLMADLPTRLAKAPIKFKLFAQLAEEGDPINDGSQVWPDDRKVVELGTITLTKLVPDQDKAQRSLMFNPLLVSKGIEPSQDPVLLFRPGVYAVSFAQRAR